MFWDSEASAAECRVSSDCCCENCPETSSTSAAEAAAASAITISRGCSLEASIRFVIACIRFGSAGGAIPQEAAACWKAGLSSRIRTLNTGQTSGPRLKVPAR